MELISKRSAFCRALSFSRQIIALRAGLISFEFLSFARIIYSIISTSLDPKYFRYFIFHFARSNSILFAFVYKKKRLVLVPRTLRCVSLQTRSTGLRDYHKWRMKSERAQSAAILSFDLSPFLQNSLSPPRSLPLTISINKREGRDERCRRCLLDARASRMRNGE